MQFAGTTRHLGKINVLIHCTILRLIEPVNILALKIVLWKPCFGLFFENRSFLSNRIGDIFDLEWHFIQNFRYFVEKLHILHYQLSRPCRHVRACKPLRGCRIALCKWLKKVFPFLNLLQCLLIQSCSHQTHNFIFEAKIIKGSENYKREFVWKLFMIQRVSSWPVKSTCIVLIDSSRPDFLFVLNCLIKWFNFLIPLLDISV